MKRTTTLTIEIHFDDSRISEEAIQKGVRNLIDTSVLLATLIAEDSGEPNDSAIP